MSDFPSIEALSTMVTRARRRLNLSRPKRPGQVDSLTIFRGSESVCSPSLDWPPLTWDYFVACEAGGRPLICIDHDHRFDRLPDVLALTHGEQRCLAFQQIRVRHFPQYAEASVLHLVALRLPGMPATLVHYPNPTVWSNEDARDRVYLEDRVRDEFMTACGLLQTDLH